MGRNGTHSRLNRLPNPHTVTVITVTAAGDLLGLSRSAAYRAVRRGDVPAILLAGRLYVPTADVYRLLGIPLPASPTPPVVDH
jgi:hypothetical protein